MTQFDAEFSKTFEFFKFVLDRAREVGDLVPPVIFALRGELGLKTDRKAYLKVWQESSAGSYGYAEDFLKLAEGILAERRKMKGSTV